MRYKLFGTKISKYWLVKLECGLDFKRRRTSTKDDPRLGSLNNGTDRRNEKIKWKKFLADRRVTIRFIAEQIKVPIGSKYIAFTRTFGDEKYPRWVSKMLIDQKNKPG
ncbi:hypothetical protein EVAR_95096_1 [Eumeta japonica]|uniref:Uncharacterized protein n=1 Tax=Eumeta variegata TaxID=151549 RepID=A0A4C1W923_EUMVA|nr:hypothetical protein EVAR_95096_1 [Eumeta japonica]